jgi:carbon-monoxide dehydrogenase medium subunit
MITRDFAYHAPSSTDAVLKLLAQHGEEAKLLAGGHSLLPMMKLRFAAPAHLIDLNRVPDLRAVSFENGEVRIGAMTTEHAVIVSEELAAHVPLLRETARQIADPQVRYRGTIGGDISCGDPGNDHPAVMMALNASFILTSTRGDRVVQAADFYIGPYMTALEPDELLREIRIPLPGAGAFASYAKLKRKTGDYATAAAAIVVRLEGGVCREARVALTNVAPTALLAEEAAGALIGSRLDNIAAERAAERAMAICAPSTDLRGDEEYKTAMAGQMVIRAVRNIRERHLH